MFTILILFLSVIIIVVSTARWKLHPFLALILASLFFGILAGLPVMDVLGSLNEGFGKTIGNIGLIILFGVIIGAFLENSGGAQTIANAVLNLIGQKRLHAALSIVGYIVCIPVFADSGFIILSSLNRVLSHKAGASIAGTAAALSMGLLATHTMVPPTPGPIAAAGVLNADLGLVIFYGLIASLVALTATTFFAWKWASRIPLEASTVAKPVNTEIKSPRFTVSILPILIPIILILLKSLADYPGAPLGIGILSEILTIVGQPVIALMIGMILSFTLPAKLERKMFSTEGWVGSALGSAAIIILITGAGGAFGKVLQESELTNTLEEIFGSSQFSIWLPFIVAAAIKTAQGSSTVAIITTASIVKPLLENSSLQSDHFTALTVVAIGAGSAVVSHANDSFFWVVTQMSGLSVDQGYRSHTIGSAILGITAILIIWILSLTVV